MNRPQWAVAVSIAIGLILAVTTNTPADAPKPAPRPTTHPTTHPTSRATTKPSLTYKLANGSDRWDPATRNRIDKAMIDAMKVYNDNGKFDREVTANYNANTPTADANYGGWINFGGQIGSRTAMHEIAHTLGVGTHPDWGKFVKGGNWTGKNAIAQLKAFDGPDAVLHADRQHFWPYGLNYDTEGGGENRKRHVKMVIAIRKDLGIKDPG